MENEESENFGEEFSGEISDTRNLGGNISLVGFADIDGATMVVVKKMVGSYGKRFSERVPNMINLKVTLKPVHRTEQNEIYEIAVHLIHGQKTTAIVSDRNLFFAIDSAMKKVEAQLD